MRAIIAILALLLGLLAPIHGIGASPCASDDVTAILSPVVVLDTCYGELGEDGWDKGLPSNDDTGSHRILSKA